MNNIGKAISIIAVGLVMTGCASTQTNSQQYTSTTKKDEELSAKIAYAPDIDVSYAEVVGDIDENIGTNVRWGGKVLKSTQIDDSTIRLTVFSHPLAAEGRPVKARKANDESGRFIVDLTDGLAKGVKLQGRFVTFYGGITSRLAVKNGDREKILPVVNAQELVKWNNVLQQEKSVASVNRYSNWHYGYKSSYNLPSYGKAYNGYNKSRSSSSYSNISSLDQSR